VIVRRFLDFLRQVQELQLTAPIAGRRVSGDQLTDASTAYVGHLPHLQGGSSASLARRAHESCSAIERRLLR